MEHSLMAYYIAVGFSCAYFVLAGLITVYDKLPEWREQRIIRKALKEQCQREGKS